MKTSPFRELTRQEVEQLEQHGNRAENWSAVLVGDGFDANFLYNNVFMGQVCLGALERGFLHDGDLHLPEGIYNCMIANAMIGDHCAVHNVRMLSGYRVGDGCLLFNIDEMTATPPSMNNDYPWL